MTRFRLRLDRDRSTPRPVRSRTSIWRRRALWCALIAVVLDLGIRGWIAYTRVSEAKTAIAAVRAGFGSQSPTHVADDLRLARGSIHSAKIAVADDPLWWIASHVPLVGRAPHAIRVSIIALDDVLSHTGSLEQGLRTLHQDNIASLSTGFVSVANAGVTEVAPALTRADSSLQGLNLAGVPGVIAQPLADARAQLHEFAPVIDTFSPLLKVAPMLLGMDKQRSWLLLMQNGSEARSTGGLIGAVGILRAHNGHLRLTQLESNDRLADVTVKQWQKVAADAGAVEVYQDQLSSLSGFNVNADFPTVGRLTAAMKQQADGVRVDGVIAMDEHTLAHLMEATGPTTVDGTQVTADNVVSFVTKTVYSRYMPTTTVRTVARKDAVLRDLISKVFTRFESTATNPFAIAKSVGAAALDGRVSLWAADPAKQSLVLASPLAHALTGSKRPTAAVSINNGGGNKLEAYIGAHVDYSRGTCLSDQGMRKATMNITFTNTAPTSGLPPYTSGRLDLGEHHPRPQGTNREVVFLHLPSGSEFDSAMFEGEEQFPTGFGHEANYRLIRMDVEVQAGRTQTLTVNYTEPIKKAALSPTLGIQPMTVPMTTVVQPAALCPMNP